MDLIPLKTSSALKWPMRYLGLKDGGRFYRSNVMLTMAKNENTKMPAKTNTSTTILVLFCFVSISCTFC